MKYACGSCGMVTDPNCEQCKGEGEYEWPEAIPKDLKPAIDGLYKTEDAKWLDVACEMKGVTMKRYDPGMSFGDHPCPTMDESATGDYVLYEDVAPASIRKAGVACVLHDLKEPHKVLLGLRNKPEKDDGGHGLWVLPGGGINEGETPDQAIKREIKEEVDCTLEQPVQLYFDWKGTSSEGFLMLYYTQQVPRTAITFTLQTAKEFTVLQWFDVDQLPINMWSEDRAAIERSVAFWGLNAPRPISMPQVDKIWEGLGGNAQFFKGFGYQQFATQVLKASFNKETP